MPFQRYILTSRYLREKISRAFRGTPVQDITSAEGGIVISEVHSRKALPPREDKSRLSGSMFPIIVRLQLRFLDGYRRGVVIQLSFAYGLLKLDDTPRGTRARSVTPAEEEGSVSGIL